ncbi:hypothetical protein A3K34_04500 [candidate division WWE3 bacterium RIFOXYC1_FULL_40_10]|uniref:Uncharacterized protein n=1 Tax=candidate division WWE3 bacterium RIFOXYA2_FULL_46_9 TaxID=1802636 RepID=A0A1F4W1G3_UNCKA|nr:MAG: hypothetical protein A3K58_04500 [candidate division WWE3 bacterium RIFOXYB1_FULL_40_22]OGC62103.1 MAG: hypothetical protein A3K37_04500 [candidate division WWE3 bacterium RIFOXYA1_FULL_40_11]OGC63118.1 MAG: hypothetical protein A2264_00245 [candidate division WWE3 bacterium RIFOXYA2_FULL_46_9]OGC64954.1 MAG: hypothetical protein A2326_02865 [candidate division WWE3 bacterium RIFOXYB2_FULL_41_6]OGC66486.1 MAG: hypothetical protein A3K34_04500 [candidate division WWE3 bacterium RIFOXYC1_
MKNIITFLVTIAFISTLTGSYAQATWRDYCELEATSQDPPPEAIICPIGKLLTIGVYAVGAVFVAVMAFGAWKMSMALGDARALEGAKMTWTYAVMGLFIVLAFFGSFSMISGMLGIRSDTFIATPEALVDKMAEGLSNLLEVAQVTTTP